jgi:hypothetical protein
MNLYEANNDFPFSNIILTTPTALSDVGTYFSKFTFEDDKPIHIQLPKSKTKNGIILSKRGCYIDLLYNHGTERSFVEWIDKLEEYCKQLIGEKKEVWFSQDLDKHDIDRMLSTVSRPYKGGTQFIVRATIDRSKMSNTIKCPIYDENENKIHNFESILPEKNIIPLVHLEGIKITGNSIDIIIKVTQLMVLNLENNYFDDGCLIKQPIVNTDRPLSNNENHPLSNNENHSLEECTFSENVDKVSSTNNEEYVEEEVQQNDISLGEVSELPDNLNVDTDFDLSEVNISINDEKDVLMLKNPNQVYHEIYKSALIKAREMKKKALEAYLDAKQIKTKYMLGDDDIESVEDDFSELYM